MSWNVNGIRSCTRKGLKEWILQYSPDVLCIQETKAQRDQFPPELLQDLPYYLYTSSAQKKGYSGVCVFSKKEPIEIVEGLGEVQFDSEGRTLTLEYKDFYLINSYYPNGQRDHGRVDFKLSYSEAVLSKARHLRKKKPVILCGDFNTAHSEIDLSNPKGNKNTTGFLPKERAWLDRLISYDFIDIHRKRNLSLEGEYTWWTFRNNCRERNIGWRIDYFFIDKTLESQVLSTQTLQNVLGSDHCPISLKLKGRR